MARETRYFIGLDAPAHYVMGQIEHESGCREGVTAFDGGMGLGQFMPDTARWIHSMEPSLRGMFREPQPYDARWAIRAIVLYDRWLLTEVICEGWYFALRAYNGGIGRLHSEIESAGTCDQAQVEAACRRKVIMAKGKPLSLCAVNIAYPAKVFSAARKYQ